MQVFVSKHRHRILPHTSPWDWLKISLLHFQTHNLKVDSLNFNHWLGVFKSNWFFFCLCKTDFSCYNDMINISYLDSDQSPLTYLGSGRLGMGLSLRFWIICTSLKFKHIILSSENNSSRMKGKGLSFLLNADGTMRMLLSLSLLGSVFVFLLSCILGNINTGSLPPSLRQFIFLCPKVWMPFACMVLWFIFHLNKRVNSACDTNRGRSEEIWRVLMFLSLSQSCVGDENLLLYQKIDLYEFHFQNFDLFFAGWCAIRM